MNILKKLIPILCLLIVLVGISVLLYPSVSDYFNSKSQSKAVSRYFSEIIDTENTDIQDILKKANDYNRRLLYKQNRFEYTEEDTIEYKKLLKTGGDIIGVLAIEKLDVNLAIYHGTDEGVLQIGLGHMQGTSLPVGGLGTHSFITGHRGLPTSTLLSDLNKMAVDDTFVLYVLGETLTYQVYATETVEPQQVQALSIDQNADHCTLVTCTPYGVNTHRLLVHGQRVENAANAGWKALYTDAKWMDKFTTIGILMVPVIPFFAVYIIFQLRKIKREAKS